MDTERIIKRAKISARLHGFGREADDISQEIVCKMLEGRHQHATIDQAVLDYIRHRIGRKTDKYHDNKLALASVVEFNNIPSEYFYLSENRIEVNQLLQRLDERTREIVILYYYYGYTGEEIGLKFHILESRISQILKVARETMAS